MFIVLAGMEARSNSGVLIHLFLKGPFPWRTPTRRTEKENELFFFPSGRPLVSPIISSILGSEVPIKIVCISPQTEPLLSWIERVDRVILHSNSVNYSNNYTFDGEISNSRRAYPLNTNTHVFLVKDEWKDLVAKGGTMEWTPEECHTMGKEPGKNWIRQYEYYWDGIRKTQDEASWTAWTMP